MKNAKNLLVALMILGAVFCLILPVSAATEEISAEEETCPQIDNAEP